jgi:uridylate kinase
LQLMRVAHFKQSGEAIAGPGGMGVDGQALIDCADAWRETYKEACKLGYFICIVSGGGNDVRKADVQRSFGGPLPPALEKEIDTAGRWGTVKNARLVAAALRDVGLAAEVLLAPGMTQGDKESGPLRENTLVNRMMLYHAGVVPVIGGGTGENNCTTDAAGTQVAEEQAKYNLHIVGGDLQRADPSPAFKATNVAGVYPRKPPKSGPIDMEPYRYINARHMLDHPQAYGVEPHDLATNPDMFGVVDRRTVETLAFSNTGVTLNVYHARQHSPIDALARFHDGNAAGTLILTPLAADVLV